MCLLSIYLFVCLFVYNISTFATVGRDAAPHWAKQRGPPGCVVILLLVVLLLVY